jgi:cobalt-zinc-cadmium efflux system protein
MHGSHDHHSHAGNRANDRAFALSVGLNLGLVAVQIVGGLVAHSLALIADAGHNLSDVLALLLAWGAAALTRRAPSLRRTYGLGKSSILASLANAVILLIAVGGIAWEAIRRLQSPAPVDFGVVAWIAVVAVVVNAVSALLFLRGRKEDLNLRGAFLHMAGDAAVSAGVAAAAVLIGITGWLWLDPLMSLAIVVVIAVASWGLLRESLDLALDAVPEGIDRDGVEAWLARLPGVTEVHDLHIWGLSTTETALTAHLVRPSGGLDDALLATICERLRAEFGIAHATIQVEQGDGNYACRLAPAGVV